MLPSHSALLLRAKAQLCTASAHSCTAHSWRRLQLRLSFSSNVPICAGFGMLLAVRADEWLLNHGTEETTSLGQDSNRRLWPRLVPPVGEISYWMTP